MTFLFMIETWFFWVNPWIPKNRREGWDHDRWTAPWPIFEWYKPFYTLWNYSNKEFVWRMKSWQFYHSLTYPYLNYLQTISLLIAQPLSGCPTFETPRNCICCYPTFFLATVSKLYFFLMNRNVPPKNLQPLYSLFNIDTS